MHNFATKLPKKDKILQVLQVKRYTGLNKENRCNGCKTIGQLSICDIRLKVVTKLLSNIVILQSHFGPFKIGRGPGINIFPIAKDKKVQDFLLSQLYCEGCSWVQQYTI